MIPQKGLARADISPVLCLEIVSESSTIANVLAISSGWRTQLLYEKLLLLAPKALIRLQTERLTATYITERPTGPMNPFCWFKWGLSDRRSNGDHPYWAR